MFSIGKIWNFEPIGNFALTTEFLTLGKALLPLSLQMLIIQISTQRDEHKVLQLKKELLKNESEVLKPWTQHFTEKTFNFFINYQNFEVQRSIKAIL